MIYVLQIPQILRALSPRLLTLLIVFAATSTVADEPADLFGSRISPFSDVPRIPHAWHYRWQRHGYSVQGRPIEAMQIGQGSFRTLVIGSVHGSESTAIEMTDQLATHLGTMADHWHEFNVLIVKTPNPDGYAIRNNRNANGVDLNRNFPSLGSEHHQQTALASQSSARESETGIVLKLMESYRPHRIVHIKSTPNATGWALCNRQAEASAAYLGKFRNLHVGKLEQHLTKGSLENCATNTLKVETITIAVPNRAETAAVWQDHRNALLATAAYVDRDWRMTSAQPQHTNGRKSQTWPVRRWPRNFMKRR